MTDSRLHRLAYPIFFLLAGAYLVSELVIAGQIGPSIDDGWIYMAFCRMLASGDGFVIPGSQVPVVPISSPVWQWIMTLAFLVGGASVWTAKIIGIATGTVAVWGSYRLGKAATGDELQAGALAIVVAVAGRFIWGSLSGMEVPIMVATIVLGLALHLERRNEPTSRWWPAAVMLALAGWARPECFVFTVLAGLDRRRFADFAILGVLIGLYPLYHLAIYGHPLPTPFYVKGLDTSPLTILRTEGVVPGLEAFVSGAIRQVVGSTVNAASYLPLLIPGLFLGIRRGRREGNGVPLIALALLLFLIARASVGGGNPWLQMSRTYTFIWPLFALICLYGLDLRRTASSWAIAILAVLGLAWWLQPWLTPMLLFGWLDRTVPPELDLANAWNTWAPFLALLAVSALALFVYRDEDAAPRPPLWALIAFVLISTGLAGEVHGRNVRDTYVLDVAMAKKIPELVPAGETVACYDLGAMCWFAQRPLLDMGGLGSPEVTFRPKAADGTRDIPGLLSERRIRWMAATGAMLDITNPYGIVPSGLTGARIVWNETFEPNITVSGGSYDLIELSWQ